MEATQERVILNDQLIELAKMASKRPGWETPDVEWLEVNLQPAAWSIVGSSLDHNGDRHRLFIAVRLRENTNEYDSENPTVIAVDASDDAFRMLVRRSDLLASAGATGASMGTEA